MARKYSNVSKTMTLTASVTITDTQIHVDDASGLPNSFPYVIVIDYEQPGVEICLVTAAAGNILTVDRGQEDTAAQPHTLGAVIVHAATAQDLQQAADHIEAVTNVHGVGAGNAVVGTGTTQTLTNKTMSGSNNTFSNIPGSAVIGPIAGTVTVGQVVGDWPIDTRSTGSLPLATRTTGSIPVDTRTTGDLPGSRLASPITNAMTFNSTITANGNVNVAGGVNISTAGQTAQPIINMFRLIGADQYQTQIYIDSAGFLSLLLLKNGVETTRFRVGNDNNLYNNPSGQPVRFLPWAMYVATTNVSISANTFGSTTVTYPAGRFTLAPKVLTSTNLLDYNSATHLAITATGFTLAIAHIQATSATITVAVDHMSVQALATTASGLAAEPVVSEHPQETVTCHTEGCENAGVPLVVVVPESSGGVTCGPCGLPIADRVPL